MTLISEMENYATKTIQGLAIIKWIKIKKNKRVKTPQISLAKAKIISWKKLRFFFSELMGQIYQQIQISYIKEENCQLIIHNP